MKNLANCTPTEFVAQTVKIKKIAQDWIDATKIMDILRTSPEYITLANPETATDEEFAEAVAELQAQFSEISEEFYEGLVQGMTEGFGDYMKALEGVSEELEDAMKEVGKAAEDAVEEATKALEGLFE
jgi:division protein CdvB (Snf7/Vps24/ESCRT-III family)